MSDKKKIKKQVPISDELPPLEGSGDKKKAPKPSAPKKSADGKKKKSKKPLALGIAACLAILYAAGTRYYMNHMHFNTNVNGRSLRNLTVDQAEKVFTEDYDSLQVSLKEKERTEVIHLDNFNATISVGSQIKDLKDQQNPWLWFMDILGSSDSDIRLDVSYDVEDLKQEVDGLQCFVKENIIAPKDAYINPGEKKFELVKEELGNTVKKKQLIAAIEEAIRTGKTSIDLEKEDLYKLPDYYASDDTVKKAFNKVNKWADTKVTYDFSYTTETVDYNLIKDWIKVSKDFHVTIDREALEDYLYELSGKYNTIGSARKFKTANGNTITIFDGDYGWKIYHDKETEALMEDIKKGHSIKREPEYSYRGLCRNSPTDDIGDSYVEVSIAQQEVWLFIDGKCKLNTSCVTGNSTLHHDTYKGIYSITYKESPSVLTGFNSNGTGYSSDVTYWMPFNGNQGLHDASWRDSFGGSIYKTNGSHGCVNLPTSAAAVIYKNVSSGFPVIVH